MPNRISPLNILQQYVSYYAMQILETTTIRRNNMARKPESNRPIAAQRNSMLLWSASSPTRRTLTGRCCRKKKLQITQTLTRVTRRAPDHTCCCSAAAGAILGFIEPVCFASGCITFSLAAIFFLTLSLFSIALCCKQSLLLHIDRHSGISYLILDRFLYLKASQH